MRNASAKSSLLEPHDVAVTRKPQTLQFKPQIRNSKPQTLNPNPWNRRLQRRRWHPRTSFSANPPWGTLPSVEHTHASERHAYAIVEHTQVSVGHTCLAGIRHTHARFAHTQASDGHTQTGVRHTYASIWRIHVSSGPTHASVRHMMEVASKNKLQRQKSIVRVPRRLIRFQFWLKGSCLGFGVLFETTRSIAGAGWISFLLPPWR